MTFQEALTEALRHTDGDDLTNEEFAAAILAHPAMATVVAEAEAGRAVLARKVTLGPKMRDGLRAYVERGDMRADEWLIARGYHPNVAASIIDRLDRKGYIEYGVSARTGWLTPEGWAAVRKP